MLILATAVACLSPAAGRAAAGLILYYTDFALGTDHMALALVDPSITSSHTVTTASSVSDFTTQLSGGGVDLAILFEQGDLGIAHDSAFSALATHLVHHRVEPNGVVPEAYLDAIPG